MEREVEARSVFVGNLSEKVTEELIYELFLQAGPVESVHIPKDSNGKQKTFGFVCFKHEESVPYTIALMSCVTLFGRILSIKPRTGNEIHHNDYLDRIMRFRSFPQNNHNSPYNHRGVDRGQYGYDSSQHHYRERQHGNHTSNRNSGHRNHSSSPRNGKNHSQPESRPHLPPWSPMVNHGVISPPVFRPELEFSTFGFNQTRVGAFNSPMMMNIGFQGFIDFSNQGPGRDRNRYNHHDYPSY